MVTTITVFNGSILLVATKNVRNIMTKITKKYKNMRKESKSELYFSGWSVNRGEQKDITNGDDLLLLLNANSRMGDSRDVVADLILLLTTAAHYGLTLAGPTSLVYTTEYSGNGASGIIWIEYENIKITEINEDEGNITKWNFSLEDINFIMNGSYEKLVDERENRD